MKVSFAQNFEDVLIDRLFAKKGVGFYIDIGAAHPKKDSVTKMFYDRGWRGINVEPNQAYHKLLQQDRPRDINLCCAISDAEGEVDYFFVKEDPKISFIGEPSQDEVYRGLTLEKRPMKSRSLNDLCESYQVENIDFLKIDVEGAEELVLRGFNFKKYKPRLVVIEAAEVKGTERVDGHWQHLLMEQGYEQVYFDGANVYYVRSEDVEAKNLYAVPLNAGDDFIRYEHVRPRFLIRRWLSGLRGK
ncbi:MAG: FkbM family methyltransferase [Bdellovibrionales bacterium]|nr:FkbM family methyltransferase [Bdellovibrionales bacterium]